MWDVNDYRIKIYLIVHFFSLDLINLLFPQSIPRPGTPLGFFFLSLRNKMAWLSVQMSVLYLQTPGLVADLRVSVVLQGYLTAANAGGPGSWTPCYRVNWACRNHSWFPSSTHCVCVLCAELQPWIPSPDPCMLLWEPFCDPLR